MTLMKLSAFVLGFVIVCGVSNADSAAVVRGPAWQPSPGNKQLPLWPRASPDSHPPAKPEATETSGSIAGRPLTSVTNVSRPMDWNQRCGCYNGTKSSMALVDAQRTLGLVRFHAAERHIDPHKIGVLGFSAGGHLVAAASTHFEKRLYPAVEPTK
jgi:hypothetical protein